MARGTPRAPALTSGSQTGLSDDPADNGRCRALWQAVLHQALSDAAGIKPSGTMAASLAVERRRIAAWVGGQDFVEVCDLAGVEPGPVRARIEAALRGEWRPPAWGQSVGGRKAAQARWSKRRAAE